MKTQVLKTGAALIAFLFVTISMTAQNILVVDNNPGASAVYTDIQSAIDAASDGDTIYVQQSSIDYPDYFTVNKSLTILGRSHSDSGYKTRLTGGFYLVAGSSGTTIKGFDINDGIYESPPYGTIEDISVFDCKIRSVSLGSSSTFINLIVQGNWFVDGNLYFYANTSNALFINNIVQRGSTSIANPTSTVISNNIFSGYAGTQIYNQSTTETLTLDNCIFIDNYPSPTNVFITNNFVVNNCFSYNYALGSTLGFATNSSPINSVNNSQLNIDPLFTSVDATSGTSIASQFANFNPFQDDLTLQPGSPAIGAGINGGDLGIFEGYNFKNFGTPTGIPSIKITSYSSSVPKNQNLTVNISAKTN